jgi:MerR family transcriptional regulator, light-induced transcriptional regulator
MRDSQHGGQGGCDSDELSALARSVVARIASKGKPGRKPVDEALVQALLRAVIASDTAVYEALLPEIRRARITQVDLVDTYFPAVARQLGCNWAEDRAGFAEVSVGMARLQSLVHQIGRDWSSAGGASADGTTVLIVLPEGEQHGFGVQVLAGQMRREGVSVRMAVGIGAAALEALVQDRHFDCAMVSVACEDRLEICRKVVKSLKKGSDGRLWVAVGGAVLERGGDVAGLTGADIATNDPMLVLSTVRQDGALSVRDRLKDNKAAAVAKKERLEEL